MPTLKKFQVIFVRKIFTQALKRN